MKRFQTDLVSRIRNNATNRIYFIGITLVCIMMQQFAAYSLPTGNQVTSGSATFSQVGGVLTIKQNSDKLITNWKSFSIGAAETTQFLQPTSKSAALNRVTGGAASLIDGRLIANGRVVLINPAGITVGAKGVINVNRFTASTQAITDADFLNDGEDFFSGSSQAGIRNLGTIQASGGDAILIAKTITNDGKILAPSGTAGLAAGTQVLIKPSGEERIFIKPTSAKGGSVTQGLTGSIQAASAEVKAAGNPYATAINLSGIIQAGGAAVNPKILLQGGNGNLQINSDAKLIARNAAGKGGRILLNADPSGHSAYPIDLVDFVTISVAGLLDATGSTLSQTGGTISAFGDMIRLQPESRLDVSGSAGGGLIHLEAISQLLVGSGTGTGGLWANSSLGNGGTINLLASIDGSVIVSSTARVSASLNGSGMLQSGKAGGTIRIGGGFGGAEVGILNAGKTVIESGAQIASSGGTSGNGGRISVWSATDSDVAGNFAAKGGTQMGNGGFVEISADRVLTYTGLTNTTAPFGQIGMLLLDPDNILIKSASNNAPIYTSVPGTTSILSTQVLKANLASSDVTVETDATAVGYGEVFTGTGALFGDTQFGKIVLVDDLVWSKAGNTSLTLNAQGSILLLASIANLSGGDVTLNADINNQFGGDVFIGSGQQTQAISVESLGKINVRGQSINVLGSNVTVGASARIGNGTFTNQFGSDITLNAVGANTAAVGMLTGYANLGAVNLYGGSKDLTATQVGHGGDGVGLVAANVNTLRSDIRVNAGNGDVVLQAGNGEASYSQIGHGGRSAHLDTGNYASSVYFDLFINARSLLVLGGKQKSLAYAQVGLGGYDARLDIRNSLHADTDLVLTGTNTTVLNVLASPNTGQGQYAQIGIGGAESKFNLISSSAFIQIQASGSNANVTVKAAGSVLGDEAYAQIGHGGFRSFYGTDSIGLPSDPAKNTVFVSAPITLNAASGIVQVISGSSSARIGHGQTFSGNDHTLDAYNPTTVELTYGNINLSVKAWKVEVQSNGTAEARIGHGAGDLGAIGYLSQNSTISVQASNSFTVNGPYALIGSTLDGTDWDQMTTVPGVDTNRHLILNLSNNVSFLNGAYGADGWIYATYVP